MNQQAGTLAVLMAAIGLAGCGSSDSVKLGFGDDREYSDHRAVEIGWQSAADSARLSGTLYLPLEPGPYAVMIMHPGSHRWTRDLWNPWFERLNNIGVAVLSYDKRGVGRSEGECCPFQDPGYFPLLAGDLIGAARELAGYPDVDPTRIGLFGFSQGGWVVPIAAAEAPGEIAYLFVGSGPTVTLGEELLYSRLTGDDQCMLTGLSDDEIENELDMAGPSLFDPRPYVEAVTQPVLWQYCNNDTSIPVDRSIRILEEVRAMTGADFTIQRFDDCNHTFVAGGGVCQIDGTHVDWSRPVLDWLIERGIASP